MLSTVRNFAVSFAISLLIFGVSAYFLVGFIRNNMMNVLTPDDTGDPGAVLEDNSDEPPDDDGPDGEADILTFLLCGLDDGLSQMNGSQETDLMVLFQISKIKKEFMFTALPCDMKVDYNGNTLRLGMVYKLYDINHLIGCIKAYTGLAVNFYAIIDYSALESVFELIGDIEYNVPMDMYYMPEWAVEYLADLVAKGEDPPKVINEDGNEEDLIQPEIDLKKGMQTLDCEKSLALLRYRDYSNGDLGRISTALEFCREILRQKVTFEIMSKAPQIFKSLKSAVTTNMTEDALMNNLDLLFSYSKYTAVEMPYPGTFQYQYGNMYFKPNSEKAITQFKEYRENQLIK